MIHVEHKHLATTGEAITDLIKSNSEKVVNAISRTNENTNANRFSVRSIQYENRVAANESSYIDADEDLPPGLRDPDDVLAACRQMLDAPEDFPARKLALLGLAAAIQSLDVHVAGAHKIARQINNAREGALDGAADQATLLSMSRRAGRHLIYKLAIDLGFASEKGKELGKVALATLGMWCLTRLLTNYQPSATAISNIASRLLRPGSEASKRWSDDALTRSFGRAQRNLNATISVNSVAATRYGLMDAEIRIVRSKSAIDIFNDAFSRRVCNLTEFASMNAIAAASGHGTLCQHALRSNGTELLNRLKTGDRSAILVALEVITHLTSQILLKMPLALDGVQPEGAFAWLDLQFGAYSYKLKKLIDDGARPADMSQILYEEAIQTVTIFLSPPLHAALVGEMALKNWTPTNIELLLGEVGHHPNSAIVGAGVYRCTSRKLQESLPPLLVKQGLARWPVALATNSPFLVSRGKPSYGVCQSSRIDEVVNAAYHLLGWPEFDRRPEEYLVGSFTTPKPSAVSRALNFLAEEAESTAENLVTTNDQIAYLNAHASWLACLIALGYALRRWLQYALRIDEMRAGEGVHFSDKEVHVHRGMPVPTDELLQNAILGWTDLCSLVAKALRDKGDERSCNLASQIEKRLSETATVEGIFTVDAADRLQPVGWHDWVDQLPENLRLRPSFGRQFWPLQLMKLGIEQLLIDVLMRHQINGLHPWSSTSVKTKEASINRLKVAMRTVISSLNLRVPKVLGGRTIGSDIHV